MEDEIIEVTEQIEELPIEEVIEENKEEVITEVEEVHNNEENDLLIEYIKQELLKNTEIEEGENINEVGGTVDSNNSGDVLDNEPITDLLSDIYDEIGIQIGYIEEYNRNNTLQSDINDVSLTNIMLILIFISILFTALLNFSRRIF